MINVCEDFLGEKSGNLVVFFSILILLIVVFGIGGWFVYKFFFKVKCSFELESI